MVWSLLVNEYRCSCEQLAAHVDELLKVTCRVAACPPEMDAGGSHGVSANHFENSTVQLSTSSPVLLAGK